MKSSALWHAAVTFAALPFFFAAGCDRPEVPRSELGTIVGEFPDLPDRPVTLTLPEGADPDCKIIKRTQALQEAAEKAETNAAKAKPEAAPAEKPAEE